MSDVSVNAANGEFIGSIFALGLDGYNEARAAYSGGTSYVEQAKAWDAWIARHYMMDTRDVPNLPAGERDTLRNIAKGIHGGSVGSVITFDGTRRGYRVTSYWPYVDPGSSTYSSRCEGQIKKNVSVNAWLIRGFVPSGFNQTKCNTIMAKTGWSQLKTVELIKRILREHRRGETWSIVAQKFIDQKNAGKSNPAALRALMV